MFPRCPCPGRSAHRTSKRAMQHDDLDALEAQSIYILREAYSRIRPLAMLWSLGKDSNVMIWLAKKAFLGRVPFPVLHLDTGLEFPETYAFRDRYGPDWGLDLKIGSASCRERVCKYG